MMLPRVAADEAVELSRANRDGAPRSPSRLRYQALQLCPKVLCARSWASSRRACSGCALHGDRRSRTMRLRARSRNMSVGGLRRAGRELAVEPCELLALGEPFHRDETVLPVPPYERQQRAPVRLAGEPQHCARVAVFGRVASCACTCAAHASRSTRLAVASVCSYGATRASGRSSPYFALRIIVCAAFRVA